ncbi:MFS transporter [Nonomuraea sp. NPDC052634]|uniref:MFS transporter n=1 Tax=Nonomuraea sp. NPDC052634 TaxID=3155813 RepID=UPI00341FDE06
MQAVVSAVLAALVVTGQVRVWQFIVLAVLDGLCVAFISPLTTTAIRGIVPPGQLHSAYAQEESRTHAAGLVGPPPGGLLYGLGRAVPFVVDAITYVAATLFYALAKVPRRPAAEGASDDSRAEGDGAARRCRGASAGCRRPARSRWPW